MNRGTMGIASLVGGAFLTATVMLLASTEAMAGIVITKPVPPPQGVITAVTNGLNCTLSNSGHYATASGTSAAYVWHFYDRNGNIVDGTAVTFYAVDSLAHSIRFMFVRPWAVQKGYDFVTMVVMDTGDGSTSSCILWPISLDFVIGTTTMDRVVHDGPTGGEENNRRFLGVTCTGQRTIFTLSMRAYHHKRGSGPTAQVGTGVITAVEFDSASAKVSGGG